MTKASKTFSFNQHHIYYISIGLVNFTTVNLISLYIEYHQWRKLQLQSGW